MDIFDQVMGIEEIGRDLYIRFALEETEEEMRKLFNWLADQEEKHYLIFKKMKELQPVSVSQLTLLSEISDIFEVWKEKALGIQLNATRLDLYRQALEAEKKSIAIYEKHSVLAEGPAREIFLKVAEEEKIHKRILEEIINRITPQMTREKGFL